MHKRSPDARKVQRCRLVVLSSAESGLESGDRELLKREQVAHAIERVPDDRTGGSTAKVGANEPRDKGGDVGPLCHHLLVTHLQESAAGLELRAVGPHCINAYSHGLACGRCPPLHGRAGGGAHFRPVERRAGARGRYVVRGEYAELP